MLDTATAKLVLPTVERVDVNTLVLDDTITDGTVLLETGSAVGVVPGVIATLDETATAGEAEAVDASASVLGSDAGVGTAVLDRTATTVEAEAVGVTVDVSPKPDGNALEKATEGLSGSMLEDTATAGDAAGVCVTLTLGRLGSGGLDDTAMEAAPGDELTEMTHVGDTRGGGETGDGEGVGCGDGDTGGTLTDAELISVLGAIELEIATAAVGTALDSIAEDGEGIGVVAPAALDTTTERPAVLLGRIVDTVVVN